MSNVKITAHDPATFVVTAARTRTAERTPTGPSFGSVLATGGNVILRGVEGAAGIVGGPLVSGAVRGARTYLESSGAEGAATAGGSAEDSTFAELRSLQEQAQAFNLQYLALQTEIQDENRRFTTLSNVVKAQHDTAKAVLQNVRS